MDIALLMKNKNNVYHIKGANLDEIHSCEKILGVRFSDEYIDYLKTYSLLSYESHELTGICDSKRLNVVDATLKEKDENNKIPDNMYLIEAIGVENLTIWQDEKGYIYEVSYMGEPSKKYNSLKEYIDKT